MGRRVIILSIPLCHLGESSEISLPPRVLVLRYAEYSFRDEDDIAVSYLTSSTDLSTFLYRFARGVPYRLHLPENLIAIQGLTPSSSQLAAPLG